VSGTLELGAARSVLAPPAPFFSYRRPFSTRHAIEASRYYPYGTTGLGDEYLLHHGIDIGNPMGAEVLAVADGLVEYAGDDVSRLWGPQADFYGNLVVLRHADLVEGQPLYSLYGHLSRVDVQAGQAVAAGDPLGQVGMAGIAMGPHLHLEVRVGEPGYEATRNPELFLAPMQGRGTIVGRAMTADGRLAEGLRIRLFRLGEDGTEAPVNSTFTYPGRGVRPTAELGENFLFADLPAGRYKLYAGPPVGASRAYTLPEGAAILAELTP
jgi:murein DD-endopeptidase MepM/ murein hydrolase activator NlpD